MVNHERRLALCTISLKFSFSLHFLFQMSTFFIPIFGLTAVVSRVFLCNFAREIGRPKLILLRIHDVRTIFFTSNLF